ncbi:hypothetical protein VT84_07000 [Gemmata sp. SH-PL17]|uniref:helix-turn-helix domain-containing protein n=1 Tax=Gemmata sp. SH-PL17 TaxID=1630693 RepID=UPI00078CB0CA|nr:helix-turn-helix domain-containing protein [Gemmata sp. SH-PL17]AMV24127.1 hypothetical protein VT84_07000 [Gemmata sp. SH-PL17]
MSLNELSMRDEALVALLAEGKTPVQAAAELGVGHATVYRALARPDVRVALATARGAHWSESVTTLKREFRSSVDVLREIRDDTNQPAMVRMRAALALADLALRTCKVTDEDVRLTVLEQIAADHRGQRERS